jgi:hypothetical protein
LQLPCQELFEHLIAVIFSGLVRLSLSDTHETASVSAEISRLGSLITVIYQQSLVTVGFSKVSFSEISRQSGHEIAVANKCQAIAPVTL